MSRCCAASRSPRDRRPGRSGSSSTGSSCAERAMPTMRAMTTMLRSLHARLLRARHRLVPAELQLGWTPVFNLGYLVFLFLPLIFTGRGGGEAEAWYPPHLRQVGPTLLSVAVFLPLYFAGDRARGVRLVASMLGIATVGSALLPFNPFANAYLIYAAGFVAFIRRALWRRCAWLALRLVVFLGEILL